MSKKTLSPKLIQLRDNMPCGNPDCTTTFKATDSQTFHYWYEDIPAYCSPECKKIGMGRKISAIRSKPVQLYGPCPTCDDMFESKDPKKYCSLYCWITSPEFEEHLRAAGKKGNESLKRKCEEARPVCPVCTVDKVKPGNKYCSVRCYRQHLNDLFDAWVANPQRVGEVVNFDEWLLQEELPCLVEGCDWKGKHLGNHLHYAHGVRAREFKKIAGFNLSTGLIAQSTKGSLQDRPQSNGMDRSEFFARVKAKATGKRNYYVSKENKEHRLKAQALKDADPEAFVPRREQERQEKRKNRAQRSQNDGREGREQEVHEKP